MRLDSGSLPYAQALRRLAKDISHDMGFVVGNSPIDDDTLGNDVLGDPDEFQDNDLSFCIWLINYIGNPCGGRVVNDVTGMGDNPRRPHAGRTAWHSWVGRSDCGVGTGVSEGLDTR